MLIVDLYLAIAAAAISNEQQDQMISDYRYVATAAKRLNLLAVSEVSMLMTKKSWSLPDLAHNPSCRLTF